MSSSSSEQQTSDGQTENTYSCEFTSMTHPEDTNSQTESEPRGDTTDRLHHVIRLLEGLNVQHITAESPVIASFDAEGVAKYMKERDVKNVICMCGAGISVNAGIPDFRSPGTGLFSRLQEMGLTTPEDVFDIRFFRDNPKPFYKLAKELIPGRFRPTKAHYFMKLLQDKGILLRCYTQNIDSLESQAGLSSEKLIAAHGNFDSARCIWCKKEVDMETLMEHIEREEVMKCRHCRGFVKPDIVFYGESLPRRFFECADVDFKKCDLLIIMGSSLVVQPFCLFVDHVPDTTPRLLINKQWASGGHATSWSGLQRGESNSRDAFFEGDCDEGVTLLSSLMGWAKDLQSLVET